MPGILNRAARELLSPAMVVALLALALSLGGTAYAAKLITSKDIKNNTVRSVDLRNGGVTAADLKDGAVGGPEIKDGAVGGADIADGGVGSADIADGGVGGADIAGGGVGSVDIADGGVGGAGVADGSIGLEDLSPAVKAAISQSWDPSQTLVSGRTVTGSVYYSIDSSSAGQSLHQAIALPARAPVAMTSESFAPDASPLTSDDDPACTGTYNAPTAPAGKLCAYYAGSNNVATVSIAQLQPGRDKGFIVLAATSGPGMTSIDFSWAYTAP